MQSIDTLFDDYATYHRTTGNKICHKIAIPIIVLSLLGLLARIEFGQVGAVRVDAALVVIAASGIYYLALEWRLALLMIAASVALYLVAIRLPSVALWGLFIGGWVLQFIGHGVYEKRSPAFLTNFVHLLIGPLWVINDSIHLVRKV